MDHHFNTAQGTFYLANNGVQSGFEGVSSFEAIHLLRSWAREHDARMASWLSAALGMDHDRPRPLELLLALVEDRLRDSHSLLTLARRQRPALDPGLPYEMVDLGDLAEGPANLPVEEPDHWIEIRLLDEAEQPIANERYEIALPDGKSQQGRTDEFGIIRVDPIYKAGHCRVHFPDLVEALETAETSESPSESEELAKAS